MRPSVHCRCVFQIIQLYSQVALCEKISITSPISQEYSKAGAKRLSDDFLRGKKG